MDRSQKKNILFATLFSALAIVFSLLYHFHVVKFLDNFLTLTYILYFIGLALMFTGGYQKNVGNRGYAKLLYTLSIIIILAAMAFIILGLAKGWIEFWIF